MQDRVETQAVARQAPAARPAATHGRPFRRRHWLPVAVLIVLAAAGLAWWRTQAPAVVRYATASVGRGDVVRTVTATGTVNPELTIIVGSYVSGVIQKLYCDYNTRVKVGQICARLDPRPYQTVVNQDKANLAVAKAQLEKDQANLTYAQRNEARYRALAQRQAVSQDSADLAKSTLDQAKAQVDLDQAVIAQRQAELDAAQVNLGYTDIVSPVDGTVVSRNVTQGQTVAASFQTPTLFLIATDLTRMQVDTNISESDIGGIRDDAQAGFTVDAFPNRVFQGTVTQVRQSPQTVQNVVTYDAVISADNHDLALKPGMTAQTRIVIAERHDVLRVPDQALRYTPGGLAGTSAQPAPQPAGQPPQARLWVLRDGRPVPVTVTTGLDDDSFTEIVGGDLKVGDAVIVSEDRSGSSSGRAALQLPRL